MVVNLLGMPSMVHRNVTASPTKADVSDGGLSTFGGLGARSGCAGVAWTVRGGDEKSLLPSTFK